MTFTSWVISRVCRHSLVTLCAIFLASLPPFPQANLGRILGAVTDQSGGVVAGGTVTILDVQRGISRSLATDAVGEYSAPNLTPVSYTVRAESKGHDEPLQTTEIVSPATPVEAQRSDAN